MQRTKPVHLRKDKTCLNCGAIVHDRFCSHCGQENTEPKESVKHLIGHFLADITHYDSKFFSTLADLIFRPGFLTAEYNAGKRVAYLNPIRMYIFISALFFLVQFSGKDNNDSNSNVVTGNSQLNTFRQHLADSLRQLIDTSHTFAKPAKNVNEVYSALAARLDTTATPADTIESVNASINNEGEIVFHLKDDKYATNSEYLADQDTMPKGKRDNFAVRYVAKKLIYLTHEKYQRPELVIKHNIVHDIPRIMFVLLPLFALFTGFFFSRKKNWYTQHFIFSLHFHSFIFIFLVLAGLAEKLLPMDKMWLIIGIIELGGIFIYLCLALRNAYHQSLWLSWAKAVGISILYVISILLSFVILIITSFILLK